MEKVSLQFQTPQDLTNFRKYAGDNITRTDVLNLILHCECSDALIAMAITKYGAVVKDLPSSSGSQKQGKA